MYNLSLPIEELNQYEVDFQKYKKVLKDVNFGEAFKDETYPLSGRLAEINAKLRIFLAKNGNATEMLLVSPTKLKNHISFTFNESGVHEEDMKVSIMSKLKEIEKNTKNTEILFDNLTPSLNKMDNLFQELTRKASKRVSSSNISQLSPTLFSTKQTKIKMDPNQINMDAKYTDEIIGDYDLASDAKAAEMELELKSLERDEADLEGFLQQLKGGVITSRQGHSKVKPDVKYQDVKLEMLIKKRNSALKDEFKHKVSFNDNYFVENDEIYEDELTRMIHMNQEKIAMESNAIKRLKNELKNIHDDNLLLETLSLNKANISQSKFISLNVETNTVFYNKNIIFKKEIGRLARENDKLEDYYTNLAAKMKLVK